MKTVAELLKLKPDNNQKVHTVAPEQMVLEALILMADKNVGALVVTDNGRVVGIFSERDYARKMVLAGRSSVGTPISAIMSTEVITVAPSVKVEECMAMMTNKRLRHLPVVENNQLVGLLSIGDLVKESLAEQTKLIAQLEQYIRGE